MGKAKRATDYVSYSYLEPGVDYPEFELADEEARVVAYELPLTEAEERRVGQLAERCVMVSLHDHVGLFPSRIEETPAYMRSGRMFTAYEALSASWWDAVFDNLMDGMGAIHSRVAWQWEDVVHDLGMRLADLAHQDLLVPALRVSDIRRAHEEGGVAWVAAMEGAAMIENDVDRIDILYGLGVRSLGIAYSDSNALGGGLKERRDGGLTDLGRQAVARMNKLGMLIDCAHCGDRTTLDAIEASEAPIVLSHIGARALWNTNRMAPDEVLEACAAKGGVIGIEAAPHTTITETRRRHGLESVMEHFEYVAKLVGIEHVGFGPDTLYGDHVGLHGVYAGAFGLAQAHGAMDYERVEWVEGLENPTEASHNILRWLVKHGYGDDDIERVVGGNALRVLESVWT